MFRIGILPEIYVPKPANSITSLTVITDTNSVVGEYYPVTIRFKPLVTFPTRGILVISGVTLDLSSIPGDCKALISRHDPFTDTGHISCTYDTGPEITLVLASATELTTDNEIVITIESALHSNSLSPTNIAIVTSYDSSTAQCENGTFLGSPIIEYHSNSYSWIPAKPSPFTTGVTLNPAPNEVCKAYDLIWTATPTIRIEANSYIKLQFSIPLEIPTTPITNLKALSCDTRTCLGKINTACEKDITCTFTINGILMPPLETEFYTTLTTYTTEGTANSNKVHEASTSNAVILAKIVVGSAVSTDSTGLIVGELTTYKVTVQGTCKTVIKAKYEIEFPSIFTLNSGTDTVIHYGGDLDLTTSGSRTISFNLVNPVSERTSTELIGTVFRITVLQDTTKAFIVNAPLASTISFTSGNFNSFSLSGPTTKAGESCTYTFTIGINHKIPSGGKLKITLDPNIIWQATSTVTTTNMDSYNIVSNTIAILFNQDIIRGTLLTVTLGNVKNPIGVGTYNVFDVVSTDNADRKIDTKLGTHVITINIDTPGDASVSCIMQDTANLQITTYTCSFKSEVMSIPYPDSSSVNSLTMTIPSEVIACNSFVPSPVSSVGNQHNYLVISSVNNLLTFEMTCKNPQITKPTDYFYFALYNSIGANILSGKDNIQTTTGTEISSCNVVCNEEYPKYNTICKFTFARSNPNSINSILVSSNAISSTAGLCTTQPIASSCVLGSQKLTATYTTGTSASGFEIANIPVMNPDYDSITISKFTVTTYYRTQSTDYEVDTTISTLCLLKVTCKYPCKTCETNFQNDCLSCTDDTDINGLYYLYEDKKRCEQLTSGECLEKYFKSGRSCLKCNTNCLACKDTSTNCLSCQTSNERIDDGVCVAECPDGKYTVVENIKCHKCPEECSKCSSNIVCSACKTGWFLKGTSCVETCPNGMYTSTSEGKCKDCMTNCATCLDGTTCNTCTGTYYFYNNNCITKGNCIVNLDHIADDSTNKCLSCMSPCITCEDSRTKCKSCDLNLALHNNQCLANCPSHYYKSESICNECISPCYECSGFNDCTTCIPGKVLFPTESKCHDFCAEGYYALGGICYQCSTNCLTCETLSTRCTACRTNNLYNNVCVNTCPAGTFPNANICEPCSPSCYTCENERSYCMSCKSPTPYMNNHECLTVCPSGMTSVNMQCEVCNPICATCSGTTSFCVTCAGSNYAYGGECYPTCPDKTTQSLTGKVCVPCNAGCDQCTWNNSGQSSLVCVKCSIGYKSLDSKCYYVCPSGYTASANDLACEKVSKPDTEPDKDEDEEVAKESVESDYLPFPHLIAAGLLGIVVAAGQSRDGRALVVSNLIVVINYVTISSYAFQVLLALTDDQTFIMLITGVVLVMKILLNILFCIPYNRKVTNDSGFVIWKCSHVCTKCIIMTLSTLISFQTCRLFYSRFMGFSLFFANFKDLSNILNPLNCFSLAQIILVHCAIVVMNAFKLIELNWGTMLYITLIESLILSILLLVLLAYEMRNTKVIKADLEEGQGSKYDQLSDNSRSQILRPINEQKLRKEILDEVFQKIGVSANQSVTVEEDRSSTSLNAQFNRPKAPIKRRRSFSAKTDYPKEKDSRKTGSYPSSPKTTKRKLLALEKDESNEDMGPKELTDNVYSDAVPPKNPKLAVSKSLVDFGAQTPPFQKLEMFKKRMKAKPTKKKKAKMFEHKTNPLEMIPETPDDNEDLGDAEQNSIPHNEGSTELNLDKSSIKNK